MKIKQLHIFFAVIVTCFLSNAVFGMEPEGGGEGEAPNIKHASKPKMKSGGTHKKTPGKFESKTLPTGFKLEEETEEDKKAAAEEAARKAAEVAEAKKKLFAAIEARNVEDVEALRDQLLTAGIDIEEVRNTDGKTFLEVAKANLETAEKEVKEISEEIDKLPKVEPGEKGKAKKGTLGTRIQKVMQKTALQKKTDSLTKIVAALTPPFKVPLGKGKPASSEKPKETKKEEPKKAEEPKEKPGSKPEKPKKEEPKPGPKEGGGADAKRAAEAKKKAEEEDRARKQAEDEKKAADTKRGQEAGKKEGARHGERQDKEDYFAINEQSKESDDFKIAYRAAYDPAFKEAKAKKAAAKQKAEDDKRKAEELKRKQEEDKKAAEKKKAEEEARKKEEKEANEGLHELAVAIKEHNVNTVKELLAKHPNMKKTAVIETGEHKGKRSVQVFLESLEQDLKKSKEKGAGKKFYDYFAKKAKAKTYDDERNDDLAIRDALREYLGLPPAPAEEKVAEKKEPEKGAGKDSVGELAAKLKEMHGKLVQLNGLLTGLGNK